VDAPLSLSFDLPAPLPLDGGAVLPGARVAYTQWGTLNADASNAILVCHALTGNQHVAGIDPVTGRPGWWEVMVGPGRPIDPQRHCIIATNVIGGCSGSTGPGSEEPGAGRPWAMRFPVITVADMVRAQVALLDQLGIRRLHAVVGGSMGGLQALALASCWPERVGRCAAIASAARHSAQNIAFHEVGRQAVMADPAWCGGDYCPPGPAAGLAVARMAAHITYLSEEGLQAKFGRRLQGRNALGFGFDADFQVESYLRHQGTRFVERFDANSYLYITRALDYFDLAANHDGRLADAFTRAAAAGVRFCAVSFDTDWLYPTAESRRLTTALVAAGAHASFVELTSPFGHDAFLLDHSGLRDVVRGFLEAA
jgi:homoserine O-acetyltransferase